MAYGHVTHTQGSNSCQVLAKSGRFFSCTVTEARKEICGYKCWTKDSKGQEKILDFHWFHFAGEPSCLAPNGDLRAELVINLFWGGNLGELGSSYPPMLLGILRSSVDAQWQQYAWGCSRWHFICPAAHSPPFTWSGQISISRFKYRRTWEDLLFLLEQLLINKRMFSKPKSSASMVHFTLVL